MKAYTLGVIKSKVRVDYAFVLTEAEAQLRVKEFNVNDFSKIKLAAPYGEDFLIYFKDQVWSYKECDINGEGPCLPNTIQIKSLNWNIVHHFIAVNMIIKM
jgi:hypothetical protein